MEELELEEIPVDEMPIRFEDFEAYGDRIADGFLLMYAAYYLDLSL